MEPNKSGTEDAERLKRVERVIRNLFLKCAANNLREMETILASDQWSGKSSRERLLSLAHQLKGSGGSHGFPRVSATAKRIEDLLRGDFPKSAAIRELLTLRQGLEEARPGLVEGGSIEVKRSLPFRILVVEDDPSISLLLELSFEDLGYQVETIADGALALQRLETQAAPDLMVLDLMLPGASGLEIVDAVRRREETRQLPIVVLSARTVPELQQEARRRGATVFLEKPFKVEALQRHIREGLNDVETNYE